ncbi:hypothetical protein [Halobaculum sp. MBLA0143]|uniref:DUF7115 domain-containing protein n=1 Tax=Halobaculum sp. MBLA0143 TaxID=3079933 RepID=UPI00352333D7
MSLPEVLQRELGEEDPVARVGLGGDDELFVTSTQTLIYRAEGLLSDESVESYPHDAERLSVTEKRRKAKVTLDYGLDGEQSFSLPRGSLDEVLHPVLAGVLSAASITEPGETVERTFRFSELTLVVTSERLVKHVGAAAWDDEYEEYHYDDVTDVDFEEGSVSTSIVLTVDERQERFKTPSEETRAVRETLTQAVLDYYDVRTLSEFREAAAPEPEPEASEPASPAGDGDGVNFGSGPDPLSTDPAEVDEPDNATRQGDGSAPNGSADGPAAVAGAGDTGGQSAVESATAAAEAVEGDDAFAESGFEPAAPEDDIAEEVALLRETVQRQREELERQGDLIEQLIEELRRGR